MAKGLTGRQVLRLLFWESTIKCNLDCAHCRRLEGDEAVGADMTTRQAKGLIDQLGALGVKQGFGPILVFSGGEPLCRDDLFELVDYAKGLGIIPAVATNGTLVTDEVAGRIHDAGVMRVSVSLDGASSEVHNKLRKLQGSFEAAIAGIECLRRRDVPFQINVTMTKHNAHELEDIWRLGKSLGAVAVHLFMLVPVGCGQGIAQEDMLTPVEYEEMLVKAAELDGRDGLQMKVTCGPHYERVVRQKGIYKAAAAGHGHGGNVPSKGCLAGLGVLFVAHQGDVMPCGYLPVKCGNVLDDRLENIWQNNPDLAKMRDAEQLKGKCGACEFRNVCGGCRARAFSVAGDYMAEEPFCVYEPNSE